MTTLLITGATGFLGGYILEELEKEEFREAFNLDEVKLLVRTPSKAENLQSEMYDYTIVEGDLLDHQSLRDAAKDVDVVIHVAALYNTSSPRDLFVKANVEGTRALIEGMKEGSTLILTSTYGVYGFDTNGATITEDYNGNPYWHYQETKAKQENLAFELAEKKDIKISAIRPPTIFGPCDLFFVPTVVEGLKNGDIAFLRKDGQNHMPFAHPEDVAHAHLLALKNIDTSSGQAYHMCGFQPTFKEMVNEFTEQLRMEEFDRSVPYWLAFTLGWISDFTPIDLGLTRFTVKFMGSDVILDQSKIEEELGFEAKYGLEETVKQSVEWYNREQPTARVE